MNIRKIFNDDNHEDYKYINWNDKNKDLYVNTISACGCIFYKKNKQMLLIKYKNNDLLDDLGGKVECVDDTPYDTIIREVYEETNGIITPNMMDFFLCNYEYNKYYNRSSKYFFITILVPDDLFEDTTVFGNYENNIERTINWYNYDDICCYLAERIKFKFF